LGRLLRSGPSVLVVAGLLFLAGCSHADYPQTTLDPKADFARIADGIQYNTLWWAVAVFVLVEGALLYAIFRFRGRPDDPEPVQTHGNTTIEIIWTVVPALILAIIAVPTVKAIFSTAVVPPKDKALEVQVIGHQWWWEFQYPDLHLTTANELHVPVGQIVSIHIKSADVLHSFWVPALAGKRDVFPMRETRLWFTAEDPGPYAGQCAEFCGEQHGKMAFRVVAQTPDSFQAWVANMKSLDGKMDSAGPVRPAAGDTTGLIRQAVPTLANNDSSVAAGEAMAAGAEDPAKRDSLFAEGKKLFATCSACHSLDATDPPKGMLGPNLANIGARAYIGAGTLPNTDANLARWIKNAQAIKPGIIMQEMPFKPEQIKALVTYLRAHQ
jgi:cytochrome c oxidase subunit 2